MNGKSLFKSHTFLLLCGMAMLSSLVGQAANARETKPAVSQKMAPKVIVITRSENDKEVKARVGDTIQLRLDSNASTGYAWAVTKNDANKLKPLGKPRYDAPRDAQKPPMVGAGGTQVFEFKAVKKGASRLQLQYRRSWEKKEAPADVFAVKVVIK